jgi:hypothetical protein
MTKKKKVKRTNPIGLSPSEFQLAEFHRIKAAQSKGARDWWKGKTAAEKTAIAKARAAKRLLK